MFAKELVDMQPDVIPAPGTLGTAALPRETRTIPIVSAIVGDPVGAGFVAGLPRPGGNITGFIAMEAAMAGKWLAPAAGGGAAASIVRAAARVGSTPAGRGRYT
jgi:hypothetical protein